MKVIEPRAFPPELFLIANIPDEKTEARLAMVPSKTYTVIA